MYFNHLDDPPPPSKIRRPWSPDPYDPLPVQSTRTRDPNACDDYWAPRQLEFGNTQQYNAYQQKPSSRNRREASDVSVEALDLADYARTLKPYQAAQDRYYYAEQPSYPPSPLHSPQHVARYSSRESLQTPSLRAGGSGTGSSSRGPPPTSYSSSSRNAQRRPFSLPPTAYRPPPSQSSHSSRESYGRPVQNIYNQSSPPPPDVEPEIDISQFPKWSRGWYDTKPRMLPPGSPDSIPRDDFFDPYGPIKNHQSMFDPGYTGKTPYPAPSISSHDHYANPYHLPSNATNSTRDLLPWQTDDLGVPIDREVKEERMRMLEREFGAEGPPGKGRQCDGKPMIGGVDDGGRLITEGPAQRTTLRVIEVLLALAAAVPALYAEVMIKPDGTPPPANKPPAYVLYVISVIWTLLTLWMFMIRPCCGAGRRKPIQAGAKGQPGMPGGMMVLPVANAGTAKGTKGKPKKGKNAQQGAGDVQVNLIVDPAMFGGNRDESDDEDEDDGEYGEYGDGSVPGSYNSQRPSRRKRRKAKRQSVFVGLAMEQQWKQARSWLKKLLFVDILSVVIWAAVFLYIMIGARCPMGQFSGWCNAYNTSTAAACLLSVSFGISTFFDIKDLHASAVSPRTRTT